MVRTPNNPLAQVSGGVLESSSITVRKASHTRLSLKPQNDGGNSQWLSYGRGEPCSLAFYIFKKGGKGPSWAVCSQRKTGLYGQSKEYLLQVRARKNANNNLYTSNISESSDEGIQKRQAKHPGRFSLSEDEREIEAPVREETTHYVTPTVPAFPCHNNAAKNNEEDGVPSRDSNSQVLKCLAMLTYEVQHMRKELLAMKNSNKCACNRSSSPAPQLKLTLPLLTEEKMAIMCDEVQEGMGMDALVNTLSVAGGDTLVKVVGNITRKLMTNDLAKVYSACGKKGKKSLVALPVYKAIERRYSHQFQSGSYSEELAETC
ncbi:uncharacterized protein LOC124173974 [Ischnura elegans]|uniref:uncharacterized protein LOC124173974 n=1 Tax=Ischnura elegans TaxID=197161 RepID=UPI001ED87726|nr:uncharacterized protein LOC124173974 [Ischnura elegans]